MQTPEKTQAELALFEKIVSTPDAANAAIPPRGTVETVAPEPSKPEPPAKIESPTQHPPQNAQQDEFTPRGRIKFMGARNEIELDLSKEEDLRRLHGLASSGTGIQARLDEVARREAALAEKEKLYQTLGVTPQKQTPTTEEPYRPLFGDPSEQRYAELDKRLAAFEAQLNERALQE